MAEGGGEADAGRDRFSASPWLEKGGGQSQSDRRLQGMCQLTSGRVANSGSECDGQQHGDGRLLEDERRECQVGDVGSHVECDDAGGTTGSRVGDSLLLTSASSIASAAIAISRQTRESTMTPLPRPRHIEALDRT